MDTKREAIRGGANTIELVEGEKLVRILEKLELGIKPKVVYEVDMDFFNDFK
jgi:restriction system protein